MAEIRCTLPLTKLVLVGFVTGVMAGITVSEASGQSRPARITEETRVLDTYPFSEPEAVPILTRDARLYPYHSFQGYAHDSEPREWKVVRLENDYIEVWVLPEVGGKVWGARVKETGHEFIYRNEVMKFRNISLRGPWTSGGIEFNFGVIGHTPSTASPVDYVTRENDDGSVSVIVGAMDLPSRTQWRVEVRLPADRAYFETNVLWHNPTPLEQPYYNWMTAAAFARDDLVMSIPGNAYLEHPGAERLWPDDAEGRHLPIYDENRFDGNKSYHVVGELNDFFGGYYLDDDYGFGHWSRYGDMPGQKLWLWALSRQGGIWEELLTDTDGQYVEFQAGRLLVQYSPAGDVNPISQAGFDPGASDLWSETWFPVEGLGGLTDASREGAMYVQRDGDQVVVTAHAFGTLADTLRVMADGEIVATIPVEFEPLKPVTNTIEVPAGVEIVVEFSRLGVEYSSDATTLALSRPFATDAGAFPSIPEVDRRVMAASELVQGREFAGARELFEGALAEEPWNREALLGLADLEYRRGRYQVGLVHADRVLRLDAYDAAGNFMAGNLYRALDRPIDAREAFGWAARSMAFRSVSNVQLAELALRDGDLSEAERHARLAIDYDRYNLLAYEVIAIVGRIRGDSTLVESAAAQMLDIDPLHHFVRAERFLRAHDVDAGSAFTSALRGEYPEQDILELALGYVRRGLGDDARRILALGGETWSNPVLRAWEAWLNEDPSALRGEVDPSFAFPYRGETISVLEWASEEEPQWAWSYLLALNLWARDRVEEASTLLAAAGNVPDYAPFYVTRAHVATIVSSDVGGPRSEAEGGGRPPQAERATRPEWDREADLRRAVALAPAERTIHIPLIQYLQDAGRWEDALAASSAARDRFPDDFNLDLLHVRSLNETLRFRESIDIVDKIRVLPSEHASASHTLFAEAHTMAALDALGRGAPTEAERHLQTAMTWPERLGLGRPYESEERLQRFLLGKAALARGDDRAARTAFQEVVAATDAAAGAPLRVPAARLDLLGMVALVELGLDAEGGAFAAPTEGRAALMTAEGAVARIAAAAHSAEEAGRDVGEAVAAAAREEMGLFADVEGRLLYRALTLGR